MARANHELLTDLLKEVSRSFYLTLRVLPKAIRPQIGLAYLLARTTDTIADTEIVSVEQRLQSLQALRERILGMNSAPLDFGALAQQQGLPAERILLEKCEPGLALLRQQSAVDQKFIRDVLEVITSGQELDLKRFGGARADTKNQGSTEPRPTSHIIGLQTDAELDDYTYRVAGCVGQFWTRICLAHQFSLTATSAESFGALAVRFGKGLQLVNILRDIPADLAKGRCYLPSEKLAEIGLTPADLLRPENEPKFRPLYNHYLDLAESHLAAGWQYTNLVPFGQMRVRLACAWPILIGLKTIGRLRSGNVLDPQNRIKISRSEVWQIVRRSVICYPFVGAWRRLAAPGAH
ncbi:MAG TPA: phytoene/squalene synthase family protein [Verrucomicrobiae bacterium]|jgi:farnesyl-diphosphate farnesyltransferase|nr:phytoene/squalene synthase family protein [Verrucomicrobiae bacterium]